MGKMPMPRVHHGHLARVSQPCPRVPKQKKCRGTSAGKTCEDDCVERGFLGGVQLAQDVPVVGQGVTVVDFELRVLHPVQQHVHPGEVVSGDVLFLSVNLADAMRPHAFAHVEQQGAGAAGEVEDADEAVFLTRLRFLAVDGDNGGKDVGNLLWGVELARLFARTGGKLADQIFVGIAQGIDVGREFRQPFGDFRDDGAEFGVPVFVLPAEFIRSASKRNCAAWSANATS